MIDPDLAARLDAIEAKAESARVAAEKVRSYMFWTGIITIVIIVLPLVGLLFAIPTFMRSYVDPLNAVSVPGDTASTMELIQSLGL